MRTSWRRLLATGAATLLATVGVLVSATAPAAAHGQLVSSDPAPDSTISLPLASIVLSFTEKPTSNAFFSVTAPSGARVDRLWSHGSPRRLDQPVHEYYHNADGRWETRQYTTAYPAIVPIAYWPETGEYKVMFVSVATDGQPVRGEFTLTYAGDLTTPPPDYRPQRNEPDPNLLAVAKSDQPTAPPTAGPVGEAGAPIAQESGPGAWILLVPVGLALMVAGVMFVYWRFRPQARQVLVSRFGGRYAAPPAPRKPLEMPPQLRQLREKLPIKRR